MNTQIYLVCQNKGKSYEIQGVFSTKEKAIAACHTSEYWWCLMTLDEELPSETVGWEDFEYDYPLK